MFDNPRLQFIFAQSATLLLCTETAFCFIQALSFESDSELPGKWSLSQNTSYEHIVCVEAGTVATSFTTHIVQKVSVQPFPTSVTLLNS